jgi:hypothetical protein
LGWQEVREEALVRSGRHCCICHKFCGIKIEGHHIIERADGGTDTLENCIPLCFDCHSDMRSYDFKHPKGTKYTTTELKRHRDNWYQKVAETPGQNSAGARAFPADILAYRRLTELLPWDGPMTWLDSFDFAASFPRNSLRPFDDALIDAKNPLSEFFDADLESLRASFISHLEAWRDLVGRETFYLPETITRSEDGSSSDFRLKLHFVNELHHSQMWNALNDSATASVKAYRNLVREAELRLRGSM